MTVRLLRAVLAVGLLAGAGCSSGDNEDTLQPLPIEGGTAAPAATSTAPNAATTTAATPNVVPPPGATTTTSTTTTVLATTTTVDAAGDWDGARFDVGTISALTKVGTLDAIALDRLSYDAPDGSRLDALTLQSEPTVAWWRTSPFVNVQVRDRTFVLAPDVEVLVVDPAGRAPACADPAACRDAGADVDHVHHRRPHRRRERRRRGHPDLLTHRRGHPHPPHEGLLAHASVTPAGCGPLTASRREALGQPSTSPSRR